MAKVTGIGGVFFKAKGDPAALSAWYRDCLGMPLQDFGGGVLEWSAESAPDGGLTVWHTAKADTSWFQPSEASFMINYRVDDMTELLAHLKTNGVAPIKGPESHENGIFAWILDPDGNKVELWQPMVWDPKNKGPTESSSLDGAD